MNKNTKRNNTEQAMYLVHPLSPRSTGRRRAARVVRDIYFGAQFPRVAVRGLLAPSYFSNDRREIYHCGHRQQLLLSHTSLIS